MAGSFLGGLVPTPDLPSASDLLGDNPFGGALNNIFPQDSTLGQLFNRNGSGGGANSVTMFWKHVGAYGTVPSNRFRMEITPPSGLGEIDNERLSFACEELELPGRSIGTTEYITQGVGRQMPYEYIFQQSITMTFRLSDNMYERSIFQQWMNSVISPTSAVMSYYKDYTSDMKLILVDDSDKDVFQWNIKEVYPKSIGPISVAQSNEGYAKQQVTLNFRDFDEQILQQDLGSGAASPADFGLPSVAQNGGLLGEINDMTGGLSGALINNYGTMLNDIF